MCDVNVIIISYGNKLNHFKFNRFKCILENTKMISESSTGQQC